MIACVIFGIMKRILVLLLMSFFATRAYAQTASPSSYGQNLVTISPFVGYATPQLSDLGVGIGYERFLNEFVSAKLPLNFGLTTSMLQTGLGLKFYPAGHKRTVKYAVGPSLLLSRSANGYTVQLFDSTNNFWYEQQVDNPLTQFGFILNNYLNITIQENIYIGAEMGLGVNYLNSYRDDVIRNGVFREEEPNVLFQFTINMGYRF